MINIVEIVDNYKKRSRKIFPCHTNRASSIGHPCIRYLVYCRTHWQTQSLPDVGLQYIFDEGNTHEDAVLSLLQKAGLRLIDQQRAYEFKQFKITAHIDTKLIKTSTDECKSCGCVSHSEIGPNTPSIPLEIKSSEPYTWAKMETPEDMINSNKIWWRKYPAQIQLYISMSYGIEGDKIGKIKCRVPDAPGIMLTKNKLNGRLKQINFINNDEFLNDLLNKCSIINGHVDANTLPDPIEPDENTCGRCSFRSICIPEVDFSEALSMEKNEYLLGLLMERNALIEPSKRYKEIDKEVKQHVRGWKNSLLGSFHISGKYINKKTFQVKESQYWKSSIKFLGEKT